MTGETEESMRTMQKSLLLSGVALLSLVFLFSCSLLWEEPAAETQILLEIGPPSRMVTVTEYEVTSLVIQVFGPDESLVFEAEWDPDDGATSEMIPIEEPGEHTIAVTHIGECDGEDFEATEYLPFTIEAMTITVINIIPRMVGAVVVEGEDDET